MVCINIISFLIGRGAAIMTHVSNQSKQGRVMKSGTSGFTKNAIPDIPENSVSLTRLWRAVYRFPSLRRRTPSLAQLYDAHLRDLGLNRSQVAKEVHNAWFWG